MKQLVIISGVTGAIGSALLAEYAQSQGTSIYGISRKALPVPSFLLQNGTLPLSTFICSIPGIDEAGYLSLVNCIDFRHIQHITYIHAMGVYPFEINDQGRISVQNDVDRDGVDDRVVHLTYRAFMGATQSLIRSFSGQISCIIFGSLADRHKPLVHASWWKTIEKTKEYMKSNADERVTMILCNVSSVLCPREIIDRPFVFSQTDADQRLWLQPHELAQFVVSTTNALRGGYHEIEKYRIRPNFDQGYYTDKKFTSRKMNELFFKKSMKWSLG